MSASLIWKRCKLDDEVSKITNYGAWNGEKIVCNNAKNVLSATNCFRNDVYSLPPGIDPKVRELYPLLQQLQDESRSLTDYDLEKMAQKINFTDNYNTRYEDNGNKLLMSCSLPFNNTYFPDHNIPNTNHSALFDRNYDKPFEGDFKTPVSMYRQNLGDMRPYDTSYEMSSDTYRRPSYGSFIPSGSLFNTSTYRSQLNTPGYNRYNDYNRYGDANNFLETPNILNFNDNFGKERSEFDYKNEFLTAFQPGNEYRNDYTTVETPAADSTRRNNFSDDYVSSFPWEKKLNNHFNPMNNPSYLNTANNYDRNFNGYDGMQSRRNETWNDPKLFGNFNPSSPLRSMMNDDCNYQYNPTVTPQRPYQY